MSLELFDHAAGKHALVPLAEKLRPQSFADFIGQEHLLGESGPLKVLVERDKLPSLILWGPPGSGKTTLARLMAQKSAMEFITLSAVTSGIKEVKEVIEKAKERKKLYGKNTLLFIDEIHRFNRSQQDAFLPHIENGTVTLIGATTENPSFEINSALLSRTKVFHLLPLTEKELIAIAHAALQKIRPDLQPELTVMEYLASSAMGDARRLINTLETALALLNPGEHLSQEKIKAALVTNPLPYDRDREEHYNLISAFIKSMRGSDPDASLYYLARMLEAGEDPLFITRRMMIFASEDIGNSDPLAVILAVQIHTAFEKIGMPEGWIPLAHGVTYLATAPKSNASYLAYKKAKACVARTGNLEVPLHLRNAPTDLMQDMGYGARYQYPHDDPRGWIPETYLPEKISKEIFYEPKMTGHEKIISERLRILRTCPK